MTENASSDRLGALLAALAGGALVVGGSIRELEGPIDYLPLALGVVLVIAALVVLYRLRTA